MRICLNEARLRLANAPPEKHDEARAQFEAVLWQFNMLVVEKKMPPEEPCLGNPAEPA